MGTLMAVNDREQIAWLHRRAGFGLGPGQLAGLAASGAAATLDALVDPDAHGVPTAPDPWAGQDLGDPNDPGVAGKVGPEMLARWLSTMASTPRPLEEWMRLFWHGHFVSTLRAVKVPQLFATQLRLLASHGLGDFRSLLRAVTVDPAMLIYLDGVKNKVGAVNENYGREVLELFALGIGNYSEDDVRAGAEALSGWTIDRQTGAARFVPRQHDDRPHTYLGRSGVHDADSVVDAIVSHPACAPFITGKLAKAILGPDVDPGLVADRARAFAADDLQIRPLVRGLLEDGIARGAGGALVRSPVAWLASSMRATGASLAGQWPQAFKDLRTAGQVPGDAPNVAGWPGGAAWLSTSATLARFNLAGLVAGASDRDAAARRVAASGDLGALADALGRPEGFSEPTATALGDLHRQASKVPAGLEVLTVALASPDLVMA